MLRKILVPWDGSPHSRNALRFLVSQLAGQTPAEVHLLNVQHGAPPLERLVDGRPTHEHEYGAPEAATGRVILEAGIEALRAAGIRHVARVVFGDPAREVANYATANHCEAIVMGTRGLGTVGTLVLGSVAHKVLHLVRVPVTLVK
jgi:nucleotide-binding universal stress UspA family protein